MLGGGYGGYGYGGYGYGGFGYARPLTGLDVGVGVAQLLLREQARSNYLQAQLQQQQRLGQDEAMIRQLQLQLQEQNGKLEQIKAQDPLAAARLESQQAQQGQPAFAQ
mmetsp:Transcript_24949/g.63280  ORF Transcript_24949/g.63280 Transcript_24949/m.63280 type:complete len:108 (+) Transcript_24949:390-713(+)